jgi:murein DD-endopeptidase MepM/ murein hydrolase activator NlpD
MNRLRERIRFAAPPPGGGAFASDSLRWPGMAKCRGSNGWRERPRLRPAIVPGDPFPVLRPRATRCPGLSREVGGVSAGSALAVSAQTPLPPASAFQAIRPSVTRVLRIFLVACLAGVLLGLLVATPAFAAPGVTLSISVSTRSPALGDPVIVEVAANGAIDNLVLRWKDAAWPMREAAPGRYEGLIGVDLDDPEGPAAVAAEGFLDGARFRAEAELMISPRKFAVQELTLPKGMAEFDNATLRRIEAEAAELSRRFSRVTPPRWRTPFLPPVEEYRPTNFGARRVINGDPRMPHSGVDIRLPGGTPVWAIADGQVAFAGEQFFGGRSVVIDHGGGVFSVYYHLKEFSVAEGQEISRGDRVGSVGATGRATGPHLHFGVRVPGGRVDPTRLLALPGR